jgi:hypothetical protein
VRVWYGFGASLVRRWSFTITNIGGFLAGAKQELSSLPP